MSYKIICDSCTDLTQDMKKDEHFKIASLKIEIDNYTIIDDETFDQKDFLKKVASSPNYPKSACPSPQEYIKLYESNDDIYVVTLSANLSGSYNSAVLAKNLYLEEHKNKNIEVFNSCSASAGQTLIAKKIYDLINEGYNFDKVVETVNKYISELNTMFVLETLETLRKAGRLSNIKAMLASALNIKPIMGSTDDGQIIKLDQARGINKALLMMCDLVKKDIGKDSTNKELAIAHCNNYERALFVRDELQKRIKFKDIIIVDTAGISSLYANDGGIIIAY